MTKNFFLICILNLCICHFTIAKSIEHRDSITSKGSNVKKVLKKRSFEEFDDASDVGFFNYKTLKSEFNKAFIEENYGLTSLMNDRILEAKAAIDEIETNQNYVDLVAPDDMVTLPIGIKKQIGTISYTLAISKAKITKEYMEVTAFVHILIPQSDMDGNPIELFFGADNVKISHKGGIYGEANLALLGDIPIPLNGGNAMFILNGGFNMQSGNVDNHTYVTIDCGGFKELGIDGDLLFPRSMLEPVNGDYEVIKDEKVKVTANIKALVKDWNDMLFEVDIPRFQLTKSGSTDGTGKAGLVFELNTAVFDFSDSRNSPNVVFPKGYDQYMIPGNHQLWRGVYVNTLSIVLPKQFKKRDSENRINLQASNLIIDGMGVSGQFSADNVLPIHEGEASKWQFSVDHIEASLMANNLVGAGFQGKIVLPVTEKVTEQEIALEDSETLKRKTLSYQAIIDIANDEYVLSAETDDAIPFNVFKATATITPNSYVELRLSQGRFKPKAVLHGNLAIKGSNNTADPNKGTVDFKGITFQNLQLQTATPYLQVDYMGYNDEVKFANFPVTISNIGLTATNHETELAFDLNINLMEKGFAGTTGLTIIGGFSEDEELHRWQFRTIEINKIMVEADLGSIQISGLVDIKDDDPVYGDGFYGELGATFNGISVAASAWFGKKGFRYWFVDAYADLSQMQPPIMIGPAELGGFGGGAYYRMTKKPGAYSALVPSGQSYIPDANSGLGFRALLGFALTNEKAFNGKVGFEMAFNRHGGLNRILFFGEAHIVKALDFEFGDKFKQKLVGMEQKINAFGENNPSMQRLKESNLVNYSKINFPQDGLTFDVGIDAHFAMEMDFQNKTFHAEMEVYVNTPGGFFKGVGPKGRAGWAVFHSGPGEWYLHVGTPEDRIGLKLGLGNFSISSTSYLMIGDNLPGSPPPPAIVAEILGVDVQQLDYMRDLNALGDGRGLAFGSDFSIDTGDMTFLIFYARFQAGLGFDIMLKDYGETVCKGSGQIGIDGWYANGQAYAYLQGELGINVRLMFIRKKIPIIKAGAAVLLQAKLPNPAWFRGYVGGHFNLLGGLVKGKFRFKVELGEECEIIGGSPLGGLKVIADVIPRNGSSEMDVFTVPQAAFNMRINKPFELEDDEGVKTYRILLHEFKVTKDGSHITGDLEWNGNNDVVNFISHDILPPHSSIKVKVQVSFQERRNNRWVTVTQDGKQAIEEEERSFTTGEAPDYIPLTNVVYSYPVVEQNYFYQKERSSGYVKLERGQPYLFQPETNWVQSAIFNDETSILEIERVDYNKSSKTVNFDFPTLKNQQKYTFSILSRSPKAASAGSYSENYTIRSAEVEGNAVEVRNRQLETAAQQEEETEVLTYDFTTSAHNTLAEKVRNKKTEKTVKEIIYSDVHALHVDVNTSERFSLEELLGNPYTDGQPLIELEAVLDDSYYRETIYPLIYRDYPIEPQFTVNRETEEMGFPPSKSLPVVSWYPTYLGLKPHFFLLDTRIPYRYHLPYYYKRDFMDIQYKVVNAYSQNTSNYSSKMDRLTPIMNGVFPYIPKGDYKVKMRYVLPGNIKGTSGIFNYVNPFN
nr:hypothetical protein [uncultured Allomuricauda sp.]